MRSWQDALTRGTEFVAVPAVLLPAVDGDYLAAALVREVVWRSEMRGGVDKAGEHWFYASNDEMAERLCVSADRLRRAAKKAAEAGLIERKTWQVRGTRTVHWRPTEALADLLTGDVADEANGDSATPNGDPATSANGDSATCTTYTGSTTGPTQVETPRDEPLDEPTSTALTLAVADAPAAPVTTPGEPGYDVKAHAHEITTAWWEWKRDQGEPYVGSFPGVRGVVERALRNGVDPLDLKWALAEAPAPTANAIEMALARRRGKVGGRRPTLESIDAVAAVLDSCPDGGFFPGLKELG